MTTRTNSKANIIAAKFTATPCTQVSLTPAPCGHTSEAMAIEPHCNFHCHAPVLDGLGNLSKLTAVVNRALLGSLIYTASSSLLIYFLLKAFNISICGWGALEGAWANVSFVVYFTSVMLPFAIILAWCYRYKKALPYQRRVVELNQDHHNSFESALGAVFSISGVELISADEKSGELLLRAPGRPKANPQEIRVNLERIAPEQTQLMVISQPIIHPIEDLFFGYTLAVDGGQNKINVDKIVRSLEEHQTPAHIAENREQH